MTTISSSAAAVVGASLLQAAAGCSGYTVKALSVSAREGGCLAAAVVVRVGGADALKKDAGSVSLTDFFPSLGGFLVDFAAAAVVAVAIHGPR